MSFSGVFCAGLPSSVRLCFGQPCSPLRNGRFARPCDHSAYTYTPSGRSPARLASFSRVPLGFGPKQSRAWHPRELGKRRIRSSRPTFRYGAFLFVALALADSSSARSTSYDNGDNLYLFIGGRGARLHFTRRIALTTSLAIASASGESLFLTASNFASRPSAATFSITKNCGLFAPTTFWNSNTSLLRGSSGSILPATEKPWHGGPPNTKSQSGRAL